MSDLIKEKLNIELKREGRRATADLRRVRFCITLNPKHGYGVNVNFKELEEGEIWNEAYFHVFVQGGNGSPLAILELDDGSVVHVLANHIQFIT